MNKTYDVAVIGGGPGGYSAAIKAAKLGAKVVLFEKDTLGGTCLNVGCIPTKCLLEKAALVEKIRKNTQSGILKDAGMFSFPKIQEHKNATVKCLTDGVGSIISSYGIEVVNGTAKVTNAGEIIVRDQQYNAGKIIIATGSKTMVPAMKGADGKGVLSSTEALSLNKIPKKLAIIGGGVIGLEFACIYNTFGTEVVVIEMLEDIIAGEDKEAVRILKKELTKHGIRLLTNTRVKMISDADSGKAVTYISKDREEVYYAEYVLMAVGRRPNTEGIEIKELELDIRGNIVVNNRMETNIPGIYAIGDVIGGYQLAHAAYAEAETAAVNCMGGNKENDEKVMPRCIYCMPQLAAVGKTEEQLKEAGVEYLKSLFPYAANGKALAADESTGMVKVLVAKENGVVLGVHIVGGYATELLSAAVVAVNEQITVEEFETMIFPHPTMSELIREAVLLTEEKAIHMPKAK